MSTYVLRRLALFVPTLIGVSVVVFVLVRLLPGDATTLLLQEAKSSAADEAALRHQLGLDQHIVVQYVNWVGTLARGDLGKSFKSQGSRPIHVLHDDGLIEPELVPQCRL